MGSHEAEKEPLSATDSAAEMADVSDEMAARIADAEAKLVALAEQYEALVHKDLDELGGHLDRFIADPGSRLATVESIFTIAHNVKGQGSSFGYQMLTEIAHSLCNFLRNLGDPGDGDGDIIRHHLSAMVVVVDQNIKGDGGELGRQVVAKLQSLVAD